MTRLAMLGGSDLVLVLALLCVFNTLAQTKATKTEAKDLERSESKKTMSNNIKDEDLIESYQEIKETLRNIFSQGVHPDEGGDHLREYLEPNNRLPMSRDALSSYDATHKRGGVSNLRASRRRGVFIRKNEALIDSLRDQVPHQYTGRWRHDSLHHVHTGGEHTNTYLNEWVVHLTGGRELAAAVAKDLGYQFLGQVGRFDDVYRMVKRDHPATHKREAPTLTHHLNAHAQFDTRTRPYLPKLDLQVLNVWDQGVTGKGVRVLVLDDGIEWEHEDLQANYDPEISYDYNSNDSNPEPRYDSQLSNSHGTRCAGEIAMVPNNHKCGVGVAYGARLGGVRMLDGPVSDIVEGLSLIHSIEVVDVVSCSWGPTDDGKRVEGPGRLAEMSMHKGTKLGRGGRGVVYVWAAGNGGSVGDNCNCDGYTSSIYTLSISSASETGKFPWYGELCTSTLAAAYSSGAYTDQKIATTDLHNKCTTKFSGTSAAAPLAAGIIALALEVNPRLTWRDMQHAVVWSSEWAPLAHNGGWILNGWGLRINPRFGFGLLNAENLINTVRNWTNVGQQRTCKVAPTNRSSDTLETGGWVKVEFDSDGCVGSEDEVKFLEHVQLVTTINYTRRGALTISLVSPQGTQATLLTERKADTSKKGFNKWPFMSVHTWAEDPSGVWTLTFYDNTDGEENGTIEDLELILYGTKERPAYLQDKRTYKIRYDQVEDKEEYTKKDDKLLLNALQLYTLPWDELLDLLNKSTRSTLSREDIEMLLKEDRLEHTLRNLQSQDEKLGTRSMSKLNWELIFDELMARRQ
ncbi:Neuroendocrine convertase 1-like [Homarus americanus]|uniref:Neuroendocrine convertase 1-like n=1 Tax=Homarus americanus TaxID=6706 RepID=A0A8J5MKL8_HOMAM|nr:Neuroendocrine convertase 1-like [Homarus americanus]